MSGKKIKNENVSPEVAAKSKLLYDEFNQIVKSGDKKSARDFLTSRVKEFPKEPQEAIIGHFFFSALGQAAGEAGASDDDDSKMFQKVLDLLERNF